MDSIEHRPLAVATYNACWVLLEKTQRTADEDAELLTNAFASRYHWSQLALGQNMIIADWMVSRAAAATGNGELAVSFAQRANDATDENSPDWLVASSAEGMARAYGAVGNSAMRNEWVRCAQSLVAAIGEDVDRKIIADQLADLLG